MPRTVGCTIDVPPAIAISTGATGVGAGFEEGSASRVDVSEGETGRGAEAACSRRRNDITFTGSGAGSDGSSVSTGLKDTKTQYALSGCSSKTHVRS